MFWFWWLMTPFVGRNLAEATAELKARTGDLVVQHCARMAVDHETAALRSLYETMKRDFRQGLYGSSLHDEIEIVTLRQTVETQVAIIEQLQAQLGASRQ